MSAKLSVGDILAAEMQASDRDTVELFPVVGLATGTILGAADVCSAGPHSTPRSTNIFAVFFALFCLVCWSCYAQYMLKMDIECFDDLDRDDHVHRDQSTRLRRESQQIYW